MPQPGLSKGARRCAADHSASTCSALARTSSPEERAGSDSGSHAGYAGAVSNFAKIGVASHRPYQCTAVPRAFVVHRESATSLLETPSAAAMRRAASLVPLDSA
jgi:hypothetical protein